MSKSKNIFSTFAKSPILWGLLGTAGFYALIFHTPLGETLVKRYFTYHPVEYMETILFAVGLASLVIKAIDVMGQRAGLCGSLLGPAAKTMNPAEECEVLLARLERLPARRQGEYYVARLRAALESVCRHGSAASLDDELKYLADADAARQHASYALFRVIVWAIPILGFLGTVIGITMALNAVDLRAPDQSMLQVLNGLGLKFDTTALALGLSMILMFIHFYIENAETSLLDQVDRQVEEELAGRFPVTAAGGEGMSEAMLQATELLMRRQAEMWRAAVEAAGRQWAEMAKTAATEVHQAMSAASGEFAGRAEVLQRAVEATGEVARLEDVLNRNLATLAGSKHFEQTVLSLAAAVNMLSARLTESPSDARPVRLESPRRSVHAA